MALGTLCSACYWVMGISLRPPGSLVEAEGNMINTTRDVSVQAVEDVKDAVGTDGVLSPAVSGAGEPSVEVKVRAGKARYDYTRSTAEVYRGQPGVFVGPFAVIRSVLDYSYHVNYVVERQAVQDGIIQKYIDRAGHVDDHGPLYDLPPAAQIAALHRCPPSTRLVRDFWAVFTAGPMGAGKTHSLRWMAKRGYFPLKSFIHADPDLIRNELPEIEEYIRSDPEKAGSLTHLEAGYVQEILVRYALGQRRDVLIQGSLRNLDYHRQLIAELRRSFPGVKIAIIHVTAAAETVLQRARRRAEATKRVIPESVLFAALHESPKAVAALSSEVDYCVSIDNDGDVPQILTPGHTWETLSDVWRPRCEKDAGAVHDDDVVR